MNASGGQTLTGLSRPLCASERQSLLHCLHRRTKRVVLCGVWCGFPAVHTVSSSPAGQDSLSKARTEFSEPQRALRQTTSRNDSSEQIPQISNLKSQSSYHVPSKPRKLKRIRVGMRGRFSFPYTHRSNSTIRTFGIHATTGVQCRVGALLQHIDIVKFENDVRREGPRRVHFNQKNIL